MRVIIDDSQRALSQAFIIRSESEFGQKQNKVEQRWRKDFDSSALPSVRPLRSLHYEHRDVGPI